jgi:hypothetical protein
MTTGFQPGSRGRLTRHDVSRFPGETLFDRLGRALCQAGCVPRKELFEAWEVARRTRRLFRGGRVVDVGGGHGLLAHAMLLLDDRSPEAIVVDEAIPPSHAKLAAALTAAWPRLGSRVIFSGQSLETVILAADDLIVSCHACGALTDRILDRAVAAGARVAVLPCCHDLDTCDAGPLTGWLDGPTAIDVMRVVHLRARGYRTWTQVIPRAITPKNRLLLGRPERRESRHEVLADEV